MHREIETERQKQVEKRETHRQGQTDTDRDAERQRLERNIINETDRQTETDRQKKKEKGGKWKTKVSSAECCHRVGYQTFSTQSDNSLLPFHCFCASYSSPVAWTAACRSPYLH